MPMEFSYQWPSPSSDEEVWEESQRWGSPAQDEQLRASVSALLHSRGSWGPHTADTTAYPGPRRPCGFPALAVCTLESAIPGAPAWSLACAIRGMWKLNGKERRTSDPFFSPSESLQNTRARKRGKSGGREWKYRPTFASTNGERNQCTQALFYSILFYNSQFNCSSPVKVAYFLTLFRGLVVCPSPWRFEKKKS